MENSSGQWEYPASLTTQGLTMAGDRGMQVVNWSGGILQKNSTYQTCAQTELASYTAICNALAYLQRREISVVVAAGNGETDTFTSNRPQFPGEEPAVLVVAAAEYRDTLLTQDCLSTSSSWCRWIGSPVLGYEGNNSTNSPTVSGVFAPGRSIVSAVTPNTIYDIGSIDHNKIYHCADTSSYDESGNPGDGYGSCTGTSMAAPHISALAGMMRSINPLLPSVDGTNSIKRLIQLSGDANGSDPRWGYGMPNAYTAVQKALATNPSRLTPLFAFYSSNRSDSFYTIVPQMASAALAGTLLPRSPAGGRYDSESAGVTINGYTYLPDMDIVIGPMMTLPKAMVWVYTTAQNPINSSIPLAPLYRFSWKCNDTLPSPAICSTNSWHVAHAWSAEPLNSESYIQSRGYKLDGIEGYIFPRTMPQPSGTERLMRKYNPNRDDIALFNESRLAYFLGQGYTQNVGNMDWLGYVYPNNYGYHP
jgi:hypothetical protein